MSDRTALAPWISVAMLLHAAVFAWRGTQAMAAQRRPQILEMDLAPLPPPPPAPEPAPPLPEPVAQNPALVAPRQTRVEAAKPHAAPAPAAAPAVLTSGTSTTPSDPVSFVTDPNGVAYGVGVVAQGGAARAPAPAAAPASSQTAPALPRATSDLTPASDLTRAARLEEEDACRGYFPPAASADRATAVVTVVVRATGKVSSAALVTESPEGQGFGAAARTCLLGKTFVPALGKEGQTVNASATVRVRFSR